MADIGRDEFDSLVRQVRTLERTVEEQQKQIAKLKRRTTTDVGTPSPSEEDSKVEVPRSSTELNVLDTLRDNSADESEIRVDTILNEAAQSGLLRSAAKAVVRRWINEGYLIGDVESRVKVAEWPSETVPPE